MLKRASLTRDARVKGIGLAQPFNLEAWHRELGLSGGHFAEWNEVSFSDLLSDATGREVFFENDGTAATIAELFYGVGRSEPGFLYVFIGPELVAGVALGGDYLRGSTGNCGDIAVVPVPPSRLASAPAPRGVSDILITRASLAGLYRHLAHSGALAPDRMALEARIAARHPATLEWRDDCVDALAPAIQAAAALLDIPTVIIEADVDQGLIDGIIEKLGLALASSAPEARKRQSFCAETFGTDAGAIGVATLPLFFSLSATHPVAHRGSGERGKPRPPALRRARPFGATLGRGGVWSTAGVQ